MKISQLMGSRVIIKQEEIKSKLLLPTEDKDLIRVGTVIAVGDLVNNIKKDDRVIYQFGFDRFPALGERVFIGNETNIIAVVAKEK